MRVHRCGHRNSKIHALRLELDVAALKPRELEDPVSKTREAHRLVPHDPQMLLVGGHDAVLHRLDCGLDGLQRGAQLVGHIRGKAPLEFPIGLDRIGHLIERPAKDPDRVIALETRAHMAVTGAHRRCGRCDLVDGLDQRSREDRAGSRGEQYRDDRGHEEAGEARLLEAHVVVGEQTARGERPHAYDADDLIANDNRGCDDRSLGLPVSARRLAHISAHEAAVERCRRR